jgi:ABC-type multidrug transport system permease subunit
MKYFAKKILLYCLLAVKILPVNNSVQAQSNENKALPLFYWGFPFMCSVSAIDGCCFYQLTLLNDS